MEDKGMALCHPVTRLPHIFTLRAEIPVHILQHRTDADASAYPASQRHATPSNWRERTTNVMRGVYLKGYQYVAYDIICTELEMTHLRKQASGDVPGRVETANAKNLGALG